MEFHIFSDLQKLLLSINNDDDIEDVKTFININNLFETSIFSTLKLIASVVYAKPHLFDAMVKLILISNDTYGIEHYNFFKGSTIPSIPSLIIKQLSKYLHYFRNKYQMDSIHSEIIDLQDPLIKSIYNDDIQNLQLLITLNNFDDNQKMSIFREKNIDSLYNNSNLIEFAALFGSLQCFKYLFLNSQYVDYENLLKYSIVGGNYDIIHITEDHIQDCEYKSNQIYLYLAIYHMKNDLIEYLIDNYEVKIDSECYIQCIYSSNYDAFLKLNEIDEEYNIFGIGKNGLKPIEIASLDGYYDFVKYMANMSDQMIQDCLYYATYRNNFDIVKFIIKNNLGNPNYVFLKNYSNTTPFDLASNEVFHYFKKYFQYHDRDNMQSYYYSDLEDLQMFEEYDVYEIRSFRSQIKKKSKIIRSKQKKKIIRSKKQKKNQIKNAIE